LKICAHKNKKNISGFKSIDCHRHVRCFFRFNVCHPNSDLIVCAAEIENQEK